MEDIYDADGIGNRAGEIVVDAMAIKALSDMGDAVYVPGGPDENGLYVNNEAAWKSYAPPKKGLSGIIAGLVRLNTYLYIIASIAVLVIIGICGLLGVRL